MINLSYATNSIQDPTVDPLAYAAEQAWKKGIVVVAAAGNTGYQKGGAAPGLADPAYDPFVIGVGACDTNGTSTDKDDTVGAFSASSTGAHGSKLPDFLAPGTHLQGLRVPNSYVDLTHPEGRLDSRYFSGSGTSEAAAWTSGVVALVLQKYPNLTTDQVKGFLIQNAVKLRGGDLSRQNSGEISLSRMSSKRPPNGLSGGRPQPSTGLGSVELSRGSDHLTSSDGVVLSGEQDIFGHVFDAAEMAAAEAAGNTWSGGSWNGNTWSGNTWSGNTWSGNTWSGNTWSGNTWSGNTWSGNTWAHDSWLGATWH